MEGRWPSKNPGLGPPRSAKQMSILVGIWSTDCQLIANHFQINLDSYRRLMAIANDDHDHLDSEGPSFPAPILKATLQRANRTLS